MNDEMCCVTLFRNPRGWTSAKRQIQSIRGPWRGRNVAFVLLECWTLEDHTKTVLGHRRIGSH